VRFGLTLSHTHTSIWENVAIAADELGLESVWLPDHLVFPVDMAGTPYADGGAPPVPPTTPLFDAPAYLSYLAARTEHVRLGTFVYLLGLRHPLITARAFTTTDLLAKGRISVGVGAGWLESEWRAAGIDPATRGSRLDEAITAVRHLWQDEVIEHRGIHWRWDPIRFDPKPAQPDGPPILVGGESRRALRRAATLGDGWMSMPHADLGSLQRQLDLLRAELNAAGRDESSFEITACVLQPPPVNEIVRWEAAGVSRLIVKPWRRTRDTLPALETFAAEYHDVSER
jgi:probable F420-dependent oxidoreductase